MRRHPQLHSIRTNREMVTNGRRTSAYGVFSSNDQSFPLASGPISLMIESEPSFPPAKMVSI
jgi:hypothetical protein